jgi:CelD/BcsL family acetyltransferase involved in cellulose biosynthesis
VPVVEVRLPLLGAKWVSLPFTDYCPPLARDIVPPDFASELAEAQRLRSLRSLEIRDGMAGPAAAQATAGVRHTLRLQPDLDALFKSFKRSQVQRNIERSRREGITVRRSTSARDVVDTFYALHVQTRRRLGVPVQPRRFFRAIAEHVVDAGLGFVMVASHGDRPVAAAVFLTGNETVVYKYGASDARAWSLRPNHPLFWEAIRWSAENGYRIFDFGRTESGNEGLRAFKNGWGTDEEPLVYSTFSDRLPSRSETSGGPGRAAAAGEAVIRRSPAWVARLLGEVLYKYAA